MRWRSGCPPGGSEPMKTWPAWRSISLRGLAIMWSAPPLRSMAASSTPMPDSRSPGRFDGEIACARKGGIDGALPRPALRGERQVTSRLDLHILEIARLVVDADLGRRDPWGEAAGLGHRRHQRGDEIAVVQGRQPPALALAPGRIVDQYAIRRGVDILELADLTMERDIRQRQPEVIAGRRDDLVPAQHALGAVLGVVVAEPHVERGQRRLVDPLDLPVHQLQHRIGVVLQAVFGPHLGFGGATLYPRI